VRNRSEARAAELARSGVEALWGSLEDLALLREAAARADAVIYAASCAHDARVIDALSTAAVVFRLAAERARTGARYHAVADEGIPLRTLAGVISRRLGVPMVRTLSSRARPCSGRARRPRDTGT
jgi:hypothetical protein